MSDFAFQLQRTNAGTINNNSPISFDNEIINYNSNISYNDDSFSFSSFGDYYISWFVTIKTGLGILGPTVSLVTNELTSNIYSSTNTIKTGQIIGSAAIKASPGLSFKLLNTTGHSIVLADNVSVTANITIVKIDRQLSGIQLQLTNLPGEELKGESNIPFDTVLSDFSHNISNSNGIITINSVGKYTVDWNISIDGSLDATSFKFELINTTEEGINVVGISESPVITKGYISGTAIISVNLLPYTLQLINKSTDSSEKPAELTLANIALQASMRIVELA